MRKTITIAVFMALFSATSGQNVDFKECPTGYKSEQFLDSVFYYGTALKKDFSTSEGYLNYHLFDNEIVFIDDNNKLKKMVNLSDYIQISVGKRSFIPINNIAVAEVLKTYKNGVVLLYERKIFIREVRKGAYGISSETTSYEKVKNYDDRGSTVVILDTKDEKEIIRNDRFYVRIDGRIKPLGTMKKLKKIFPDKTELIESELNKEIEGESEVEKYLRIIGSCCN